MYLHFVLGSVPRWMSVCHPCLGARWRPCSGTNLNIASFLVLLISPLFKTEKHGGPFEHYLKAISCTEPTYVYLHIDSVWQNTALIDGSRDFYFTLDNMRELRVQKDLTLQFKYTQNSRFYETSYKIASPPKLRLGFIRLCLLRYLRH